MSRLYSIFFNSEVGKGIEPHPTNGHTQNNLSNDIQTHGASTISGPAMPVRNEWFASPFSFSTYIIPQPLANVKSLFKRNRVLLAGEHVLIAYGSLLLSVSPPLHV